MNQEELLELQRNLVSYLADPSAFEELEASRCRPPMFEAIDPAHLKLVGSLAQGKRMSKIMRLLPRTFSCLTSDRRGLFREFSLRYQPRSAESYVNALQFYVFLRRRWRKEPAAPPFLPDLAYCELALAGAARTADAQEPALSGLPPSAGFGPIRIRRRPGVYLRCCQYDIHPLLDPKGTPGPINRERTFVIVTCPLNSNARSVLGVNEAIFETVRACRSWQTIEPGDGLLERASVRGLFRRLEELGIVEVRPCASA